MGRASFRPEPSRFSSRTSRDRRGCSTSSAQSGYAEALAEPPARRRARRSRATAAWRSTPRATRSSSPSRRAPARSTRPPRRSSALARGTRSACGWASTPARRTSRRRATSGPTCTARPGSRPPPTAARSLVSSRHGARWSTPSLLRDLGEHRLKDLAAPQQLYQLLVAGCRTTSRRCGRSSSGRRTCRCR